MALGPLTLDVNYGVSGQKFQATISGGQPGSTIEVLNPQSTGFYVANGRLYNDSLPARARITPILRETLPGTGTRDSRIDIAVDGIALGAAGLPSALSSVGVVPAKRNIATNWGDSRDAALYLDTLALRKNARSALAVANAMSGQRLVIGPGFGVSGDRTDQALARVPGVIASGAGLVHVWCGVNDLAQDYPSSSTSGATAAANIITACEAFRGAGMAVILEIEMGANSLTAGQVIQMAELNARLYEYAERAPNIYLHDARPAVMNNDFSDTLVNYRTGYSQDGTHQNARGAFYHARSLANIIQAVVPPRYGVSVGSRAEKFGTGGYQLLDNNTFSTATGGTAGSGISGNVPAGFTADSTATATLSSAANPNGLGNQISAAITFTAAGQRFRLWQSPSSTRYNIGDVLEAEAQISITGTPTGLLGAYLDFQVNTDTATTASDLVTTAGESGPDLAHSYLLKTRPFTVTGASKSFFTAWVYVTSMGAGTVNLTVDHMAIRKRTSAPF